MFHVEQDPTVNTEPSSLWLRTICLSNGLSVDDGKFDLLSQYVQLLLEWNEKINLISRRDVQNVWVSHILHSISPLLVLRLDSQASVLDLGSGGGLPGIPIKIINPSLRVILLDSTQKKIIALQEIIQKLSLSDVEAVWGRAEEVGPSTKHRGKYDYVVARAVAPLKDLVKWSFSFLRTGGARTAPDTQQTFVHSPALIALKGGDVEKETMQAKQLRCVKSIKVTSLTFKGSEQLLENDKKIIVVQF